MAWGMGPFLEEVFKFFLDLFYFAEKDLDIDFFDLLPGQFGDTSGVEHFQDNFCIGVSFEDHLLGEEANNRGMAAL